MPTADSPAAWRDGWRAAAKAAGAKLPREIAADDHLPWGQGDCARRREKDWTVGTYQIEDDGWEDATHYLVVRGTAEDDPNLVIVPGGVPLVSMETGEIEYVAAHTEWDRLDAMWSVRLVIAWLADLAVIRDNHLDSINQQTGCLRPTRDLPDCPSRPASLQVTISRPPSIRSAHPIGRYRSTTPRPSWEGW
jgi:hypothetical protein